MTRSLPCRQAAGPRAIRSPSPVLNNGPNTGLPLAKRPAETPKQAAQAAGGDDPPPDGTKGDKAKKPKQVRVSTTDPDAILMKMADGAVRPAYNVQVTSACGFVVAIEPVEQGNDRGLAPAMVAQVEQTCATPLSNGSVAACQNRQQFILICAGRCGEPGVGTLLPRRAASKESDRNALEQLFSWRASWRIQFNKARKAIGTGSNRAEPVTSDWVPSTRPYLRPRHPRGRDRRDIPLRGPIEMQGGQHVLQFSP